MPLPPLWARPQRPRRGRLAAATVILLLAVVCAAAVLLEPRHPETEEQR